jgi:hypothetical protein
LPSLRRSRASRLAAKRTAAIGFPESPRSAASAPRRSQSSALPRRGPNSEAASREAVARLPAAGRATATRTQRRGLGHGYKYVVASSRRINLGTLLCSSHLPRDSCTYQGHRRVPPYSVLDAATRRSYVWIRCSIGLSNWYGLRASRVVLGRVSSSDLPSSDDVRSHSDVLECGSQSCFDDRVNRVMSRWVVRRHHSTSFLAGADWASGHRPARSTRRN